jgi:hypothetical protein
MEFESQQPKTLVQSHFPVFAKMAEKDPVDTAQKMSKLPLDISLPLAEYILLYAPLSSLEKRLSFAQAWSGVAERLSINEHKKILNFIIPVLMNNPKDLFRDKKFADKTTAKHITSLVQKLHNRPQLVGKHNYSRFKRFKERNILNINELINLALNLGELDLVPIFADYLKRYDFTDLSYYRPGDEIIHYNIADLYGAADTVDSALLDKLLSAIGRKELGLVDYDSDLVLKSIRDRWFGDNKAVRLEIFYKLFPSLLPRSTPTTGLPSTYQLKVEDAERRLQHEKSNLNRADKIRALKQEITAWKKIMLQDQKRQR